jgi:hypothetical protein
LRKNLVHKRLTLKFTLPSTASQPTNFLIITGLGGYTVSKWLNEEISGVADELEQFFKTSCIAHPQSRYADGKSKF